MLYFAEAIRGYLGRNIKRNEKSRHENDDDDDIIYIYTCSYLKLDVLAINVKKNLRKNAIGGRI